MFPSGARFNACCSVNSQRRAVREEERAVLDALSKRFFFSPLRKGWEEIAFTVGVEFTCNNLGVRQERK